MIELHAVDADGEALLENLLAPFFTALYPAFKDKADEIIIKADRSGAADLSISYKKGDRVFTLGSCDFQPFVASSRIRIMSGMSINPDKAQHGKMFVHFQGVILPLQVVAELENNHEILRLKPAWEYAQ